MDNPPIFVRGMRCLAVFIVTVCFLYALACFGLYAYSAGFSPVRIAASSYLAPDLIRRQYLHVEAGGAQHLHRSNPLMFWPEWYTETRRLPRGADPDKVLVYKAVRIVQSRYNRHLSQAERHAAAIALSIRIGRQWTVDQAANTILAESGFGKGIIGIEAAAQHYYGVPAAQLRPQESLALITLMKGPAWYSPYCHPKRFAERYALLAAQLEETSPEWNIRAARSRMTPAACESR